MTDDRERPVLNQINLVVRDIDAASEFYRRLGVEIPSNPQWDADHRSAVSPAGLDLDIDSSAFAQQWDAGWPAGSTGPVIGFGLATRDAVDATYADLVGAGSRAQQPPYDAFWGARYAVVLDPDGNAVGLMSPVDPARRTPAPTPPSA